MSADALLRQLRSIVADHDAIGSEGDRLALQEKLRKRLKRPGVAAADLLAISVAAGYGDPTKLPHNKILISTHAGRRTLLEEHLSEHLAYTADEDEEALGEDEDEVLEAWLSRSADAWPPAAPPPPASDAEALDPDGRWGARACGVEVRECVDVPAKGRGAFAIRPFARGELVGVYWGEGLTQRQWAVRHGWKNGETPARLTDEERHEQAMREARLLELEADEAALLGGPGAPMGGVNNGGSYVFSVLMAATEPERLPPGMGKRVLYVDAEDGTRSTWTRYINHAHYDTPACNLEPRSDPLACRVWFEARRDIAPGEELLFSYGAAYNTLYGKGAHEASGGKDWHSL
jgi:hypothetical protein